MELENSQNNALAKLPMLKLGKYEMWEIRIKQYFQIQDYALWEVIENGNSCGFMPFCQHNHKGLKLVHEVLEQFMMDDLEEMILKWNMALLSPMRARSSISENCDGKIIIDWKAAMCAIDGAGFDWRSVLAEETEIQGKNISKENLYDDLLVKVKEEKEGFEFKIAKFEKSAKDLDQLLANQHPLGLILFGLEKFKQPETDSSSVKSPLKVDKDWKEKFFSPANQVREEEPKKSRENNDAPIIKDWVSDDEDNVEPISKVEKKTCYNLLLLRKRRFLDSGCSRHMSGNIAHLLDFKDFDGGYVTFGGGENGGRITGKWEKGIKREYSVARTPQQNGVAERKNRTLIEAARTMLADSKLPTTFWGSCFYCLLCIQGVSESSTSSQQDQDNQDCIIMPIWKDASYFNDASPKSVADA
ncbi:retrovirus-related pol polyprotein from transposon TNT 1-94 [Tanacetum coccineum]